MQQSVGNSKNLSVLRSLPRRGLIYPISHKGHFYASSHGLNPRRAAHKSSDRLAKREHRSRSELLREAARRYLSQPEEASTRPPNAASPRTARHAQKWTKEKLEQFLLDKGVIRRGCPELEALLGPTIGAGRYGEECWRSVIETEGTQPANHR